MDLVNGCLDRIAALDGALNSFVDVTADRARRRAREAEAAIAASGPRSVLHGIPYCLKDVFDEATVLRVGDAYERATAWRDRRPDTMTLARRSPPDLTPRPP